jgi:hypothetical protein
MVFEVLCHSVTRRGVSVGWLGLNKASTDFVAAHWVPAG